MRARRVGASNAPVLLTGESGTGKELFAQLVHDASQRAQASLVRVNCAALSRGLIESELFGHEKGAFTDAVQTRKGRFELARDGSLLLDEVSEVPTSTQCKLLRVLESNEFERVGSSQSLQHNVRIIASSNRDMAVEVQQGRFRLDLFHRINVVQLRIPPLRERKEDIPLLAMHFLERFKKEGAVVLKGFTRAALQRMANYHWPGNVRELRNVVHGACIFAEEAMIGEELLQLDGGDQPQPEESSSADRESQETVAGEVSGNESGQDDHGLNHVGSELPEQWLRMRLADIERQIITAAIEHYGNRQMVAETLGVSPRTLTNKIRLYRESDAA
ncbi:Transcriptional regulatory protein ZraR [Planctomycetes bacterium K23_9]|uniref:Transcriptional regulatory protein ZraR n=2 Tax=Stieleria marina TaxID=1930275 RepID=A0A517NXL7_9BACT|nr:Transcriptional regulatory protein ZraR [Planctomycetes bacterium K23_9]